METTLYRCTRCSLLFGAEEIPEECPACRRRVSIPPRIELAGRDLTEFVIRSTREELLESGRKGLATLKLGICEHGYIHPSICTHCI